MATSMRTFEIFKIMALKYGFHKHSKTHTIHFQFNKINNSAFVSATNLGKYLQRAERKYKIWWSLHLSFAQSDQKTPT